MNFIAIYCSGKRSDIYIRDGVKILIRDIRKLPHITWLVEAIADDARRQLSGKLQFVKNRKSVESSRIRPDDSIPPL